MSVNVLYSRAFLFDLKSQERGAIIRKWEKTKSFFFFR